MTNELIELKGPTVVYAYHAIDQKQRTIVRDVGGRTLREMMPKNRQANVCVLNGGFVLPEDQDWIPGYDDHVTYLTLPKGGGNASSSILGIILIIVGIFTYNPQLIGLGVGLLVIGLLPVPNFAPLSQNQEAPSPTYNIQLSGNTARLGQAIPVLYGRHIIVPDFASQSYAEFNDEGDQFYCALLCLGQIDKFTLESIMIDDTELSHFEEVETQLVGPQYTTPLSLVDPAVVNAVEVASQDLLQAKPVGPFASCGPGLQARYIGIDILCPKGLYLAEDDGSLGEKTVRWWVEARMITDLGGIAGPWNLLGNESLTMAENSPVRRSYKYTVTPGRYEVRVTRQDLRDENIRAGHDLQWMGMRSYLTSPAPLEPSATFLAVRVRATSQLSGLSQRRISVVVRRWLQAWDPDDGWLPAAETSSIAWAIADVLRNTSYGGQVVETRIDLQTLYDLEQIWISRGDEFSGVFDKRVTVWSAITTIARAGRARPIMRGGVFTFVRDGPIELPAFAYGMRNIKRNSFNFDYVMASDDETDGLELEFFSENTWASDYVTFKVEDDNTITLVGPTDDGPVNPMRMQIMGVTKEQQAQNEGFYLVATQIYRRGTLSFITEMEGYLPCYGDLIAVAHDLSGWGISGDAEQWGTPFMTCSEDLDWSTPGQYYAILTSKQGDTFGPYMVAPGPEERQMQFLELPDDDIEIYTGTERERTRFAMGPSSAWSKLCKIVGITPQGDNCMIRAVIEDARVHTAEGTGGGTSGPGRLARYAPDGIPNYNAASDAQHNQYGFFSDADRTVGTVNDEGYVYGS